MAKGNFIEYIVRDNHNKYPDDGEQSGYYYVAMEDVTPEVTTQTPIIQNITEALVGKAQGATATADKILEGFSAYVGQELVNGIATKSGLYVWKRWKIESEQVTLSFSVLNSRSPYQLKVDCDNEVALKIESASSFVGLHGIWNGNGYYEFPDANTLRIYDGSNIYNFASVYDSSTNIFSVTSATGIGNTSQFADCTHTMQAGSFEGFIVSDNESTYPDGGTQGKYWYEKVVEGVSGINYGEITLSSDTKSVTIEHNLNCIPSFAVLVPTDVSLERYNTYYWIGCYGYKSASPRLYNNSWDCSLSGNDYVSNVSSNSGTATANSSVVTFSCYSIGSAKYRYGTYKWFAIA